VNAAGHASTPPSTAAAVAAQVGAKPGHIHDIMGCVYAEQKAYTKAESLLNYPLPCVFGRDGCVILAWRIFICVTQRDL
jgi:hypothetical protein